MANGRELLPAIAIALLGLAAWMAPKDTGLAIVVAILAGALGLEWRRGLKKPGRQSRRRRGR